MLEIFGYISGILMLLCVVPYIRDILLLKTKPQRASYFIWLILAGISLFSQAAKGGTWSLLFTVGNILGLIIIFTLSIKHGVGGYAKRDIIALCGAGISLILWYFTKEPAVALFLVIFIDFIGALLTITKSYEHPETETLSAWVISFTAGLFGVLAVGKMNIILLAYPFYIFIADLLTVIAILIGRRRAILKTI